MDKSAQKLIFKVLKIGLSCNEFYVKTCNVLLHY